MKRLVTHSNGFHADDVFAYAILKEVFTKRGETWSITRSRDQDVIDQGDIVFDIGDRYDPSTNRYDHHQKERAGTRENGILYASAGLVWKHFGRELCSSEEVWQAIDQRLICELDALDNGQDFVKELSFEDATYTSIGMHAVYFESDMFSPRSPEILLGQFEEASEFARGILVRMIAAEEALERAFRECAEAYAASDSKEILVLDFNYQRPTWKRLAAFRDLVYVVYPNSASEQWKVECIPLAPDTLESRKLFPEFWRGLQGEELAYASGAEDAHFCHASGFLLGTGSKKTAIELAHKSLIS